MREQNASCLSCLDAGDQRVSVHVSEAPQLSFFRKNFHYQFMTVKELLNAVEEQSKTGDGLARKYYYFRSLGRRPQKDPSQLPENLRADFGLPSAICPDANDSHAEPFSNVLRIASSGMELWPHYDMPHNFLVQIRGAKRVQLYPPDQASNLYITGSTSRLPHLVSGCSVSEEFPRVKAAYPHGLTVDMRAGDVLFIPALWVHSVYMLPKDTVQFASCSKANDDISDDCCISVNSFFYSKSHKKLEALRDTKDIYGNKDLLPFQYVVKHVQELSELPEPYFSFYRDKLALLAEDLRQTCDEEEAHEFSSSS